MTWHGRSPKSARVRGHAGHGSPLPCQTTTPVCRIVTDSFAGHPADMVPAAQSAWASTMDPWDDRGGSVCDHATIQVMTAFMSRHGGRVTRPQMGTGMATRKTGKKPRHGQATPTAGTSVALLTLNRLDETVQRVGSEQAFSPTPSMQEARTRRDRVRQLLKNKGA